MHGWRAAVVGLVLFTAAPGCSPDSKPDPNGNPYAGHVSAVYEDPAHWLCHPDRAGDDNICQRNLEATVVHADGTTTLDTHTPHPDPPLDCFYVYPTVSIDDGGNSDLNANAEEISMALTQVARYSSVCRVLAPVYRQTTILALIFGDEDADRELAYADVLDAFKHYMAQLNNGRGVLLVGHSQGSFHLIRLIQQEVERSPYLSRHLVAAHLIGAHVVVPTGQDVGTTFLATPLCRSPGQIGCVVTYASFRAEAPPTAGDFFGATDEPASEVGCTNPSDLTSGLTPLDSYFPTEYVSSQAPFVTNPGAYADPSQHPPLDALFFKLPGMVAAQCVQRDGFSYLEIEVTADASDPRVDNIGGDFQEGWGLHVADMYLTMGNLVALAGTQANAWLATQND